MQRRRGKYMFWSLVAINSFLLIAFVLTSRDFHQKEPSALEECFNVCICNAESISSSKTVDQGRDNATIVPEEIIAIDESTTQQSLHLVSNESEHPWKRCPEPGLGLQSTFLTSAFDGRLGNLVWNYLSLWASASRYNVRPVMNQSSMNFLYEVFNHTTINIPTVEEMDVKCNLSGSLSLMYYNESSFLNTRYDLFNCLEVPPDEGYKMIKFGYYSVISEELVPYWNQLTTDLVLQSELVDAAQRNLHEIKEQHFKQKELLKPDNVKETPEFVGVHVRRTDYMNHMSLVYPGSTAARPDFFHNAMGWLFATVKKPLVFVIVSDDADWAKENIISQRADSFLGGNSDVDNPGLDLALLGACNHTIFAYGTFGLTGALLASRPGGYTVIFDPLNGTVTKEMEFAANLPGWRIMDNDGNFNFENTKIDYAYGLLPRPSV